MIKNTEKQGLAMRFRSPGLTRQLASFLAEHADRKYLLPESARYSTSSGPT